MILNTRSRQIVQRDFSIGSHQSWSSRFTIPRNWLVGEWLLNGNALDTSGNGNNGTATNVTYASTDIGYQSQTGVFNGTTTQLYIPFSWLSPMFKSAIWWRTIYWWSKANTVWEWWWYGRYFQKQDEATNDTWFALSINNTSTTGMFFVLRKRNSESSPLQWSFSWLPDQLSSQHFYWFWYDTDKTNDSNVKPRLWVDGIEYTATFISWTYWTYSDANEFANMYIGSNNSWTRTFDGKIQYPRIYDWVPTTQKINTLYKEWLKLLH